MISLLRQNSGTIKTLGYVKLPFVAFMEFQLSKSRSKETTPPIDQRGKHNNRPNRTFENTIECVKTHILSFPCQIFIQV